MICTFYSYKGGVGRSMALANVADILSRRGLKVLMIDFDLEAPGLEQFFYRADEREQRDAVRRQSGLLDLLLAYKDAMSVSGGSDDFRDVKRYIASIFPRRPHGGRLDLMPAGERLTPEQLARYALALRSFDWQDFYFNWEGDLFFEWLRRELVALEYDLVLIDSRTGVTEMGGICGYQLADVIVMMCGANHQNVDGTWSMLEDFRSQPVEGLRRGRPLEIMVVPARVEQRAPELLDEFYERFDRRFGDLLPERLARAGISFRDLTVPYDPQFAFEERVARNPEEKAAKEHLAGIFGKLADVITSLSPRNTPPDSPLGRVAGDAQNRLRGEDAEREEAAAPREGATEARYDETKRFADFDILLSYAKRDAAMVSELRGALLKAGIRVTVDAADNAVSADWKLRMEGTLAHTRALAVCLGAGPFEAPQQRLVALTLMARDAGRDMALLPVLLPGHEGDEPADRALAEFVTIDLRRGVEAEAVDALVAILRRPEARPLKSVMPAPMAIESEERCPYIGPLPFSEHHSDLFFGRDDEIRRLHKLIDSASVTLLIGPSSCGKTSLVRAGIFPALRGAQPQCKLIEAATANQVGRAVARALPGATTQMPDLRDAFDAIGRRPPGSVLVAIDRLSQLPGPNDEPAREGVPVEFPPGSARGALVEAVVRALVERGAKVLLSLRSDEIDEWELAVAGTPLAEAARFELRAPDREALRQIAERPADVAGLAFEPGLVDRVLSRSEGEAGALPFLQATLCRLWQERRSGWLTNAAYDSFGGLRGILVEQADRYFEELDGEGREGMRRIVLRLLQVAASGTRASGQRVRLSALAPTGGPARLALEDMVDAGLLVVTRDKDGAAVELAHEALARDWPRVMVWLELQRDFLEWHHRLQAEADAWMDRNRASELLLHGPPLDEARRLRDQYGEEVGQDVAAFIDASNIAAEHARTRKVRVRTVLATVFLGIAMAAATGWFTSVRKSADLRAQTLELTETQEALLEQLKGLEGERNTADAQKIEAQAQLSELQRTLDEALHTARTSVVEGERASAAVAELELAVKQTEMVVEKQRSYSINRAKEIEMQQSKIRNVLTRSTRLPGK